LIGIADHLMKALANSLIYLAFYECIKIKV